MAPKKLTLLESVEEAQSSAAAAKRRRTLKPHNTDDVVNRILENNFRDMQPSDIDGREVEGMTLRARLRQDAHQKREGKNITMGKKYYDMIRGLYKPPEAADSQLRVVDKDAPVDAGLRQALADCMSSTAGKSALSSWLAANKSGRALNQREAVGLLRLTLGMRVSTSSVDERLSFDVLKFLHSTGTAEKFPDEMRYMKAHFDLNMVAIFSKMKNEGLGASTFWDRFGEYCVTFLDKHKVGRIIAAESWAEVLDDIRLVVTGSQLGRKMFAYALGAASSDAVRKHVSDRLDCLKGEVTAESVAHLQAKMTDYLEVLGADLPNNRKVLVHYRGQPMEVDVCSLHEEVTLRIQAHLRGQAVDAGLLVPMRYEFDLVPKLAAVEKEAFAPDVVLLQEAAASRKQANKMLEENCSLNTGAMIADFLASKSHVLLLLDPAFKLELAWLKAMVVQGAKGRLRDELFNILPKAGVAVSLEMAASKMEKLVASRLFGFCTREQQAEVKLVVEMVGCMASGKPAMLSALSGKEFADEISERLAMFCATHVPCDSDKTPRLLQGKPAATFLFEDVKSKMARSEAITLGDLEVFFVHANLLSAEQQATAKAWAAQVLKQADLANAAASSDGSATKSSATARPAAKKRMPKASPAPASSLFD